MRLKEQLVSRRWQLIETVCVLVLCALGIWVRAEVIADRHWCFAGSDSFGYAKLGHELHDHFRYALGPLPEPLSWVRPPLYPMFLSMVFPTGDVYHASWNTLFATQIGLDVGTGLLAFAMARRLAGPLAGLLALALTQLNPFTPLFSVAMLTETLATFLSTASAAAIMLGARRPRRWWPLAGALIALSTLLRPDGLLVAVGFAPALLVRGPRPREKLLWCAAAVVGFVVVFSPWPIRNLVQFGTPHPLGGRIDRYTRPVTSYEGYWSWLRSWARDWDPMTTPTTCFYDDGCDPRTLDDLRRRGAYVDVNDEPEVRALIARRYKTGLTPPLSNDFQRLADARRKAHPLLVEAWLPISRAWYMWCAPFDELLQSRPPWKWGKLRPHLYDLARLQWLLFLGLGALLCLWRRTRLDAGALYLIVIARTLILAFTFYSMPRYAIEVMPLCWTLIAGGAVAVLHFAFIQLRARFTTKQT